MTTARRGFKSVAPQLIREKPGLTSDEYARIAIRRGLAGSNATKVDPVFSLKTTLDKEYREGRMPEIKKIDGRYYPTDGTAEGEVVARDGLSVQLILPAHVAKRVNDLLDVGQFHTSSEAVIWLVEEGIRAKQAALDQIAKELEEIKRRKESARRLLDPGHPPNSYGDLSFEED